MNDWLTSFLGTSDLNGSSAPNSSAIPLSTSVDTSGGNTNTSGFNLGNFLSGLGGLGSSAATAYETIMGRPAPAPAASPAVAAATPAASFKAYLPWILTITGVVALIALLTRASRR